MKMHLKFNSCFYLCLTFISILIAPTQSRQTGPIVKTPWATIEGLYMNVANRSIKAYLGIPFALPPVGHLRFTKSLPLRNHYRGIYHADKFQFACMQTLQDAMAHGGGKFPSENCLFLNIWTPLDANRNHSYPVLAYIHGSAFLFGSTASSATYGDILSAYGELIVVTMNHRLGAFGLAYGDDKFIPGNQVDSDLVLCLHWIQENIASFGGDPSSVTLSGMSSGSELAASIFLSPSVPNGLFHRVMLMSGVPFDPVSMISQERSLNITKQLSRSLGCSKSDDWSGRKLSWKEIYCLKHVSPEKIAYTIQNALYLPTYGDNFMPKKPQDILAERVQRQGIPILAGLEENEDIKGFFFSPKTVSDAKNNLKTVLHDIILFLKDIEFTPLLDDYYKNINESDVHEIQLTYHKVIGDAMFDCPVVLFAEQLRETNDVYLYRNMYVTDAQKNSSGRPFGTAHADDAGLFLGKPFREPESHSDSDRHVSQTMMKLVGNFARGKQMPWPRVGSTMKRWKIQANASFDNVDNEPDSVICSKWRKYFRMIV